MDFTVENICGLLIRSRLMTPQEVKSNYQRWLAEAKDKGANVSLFTKWLVSNNRITEYQAALVTKGHANADDFYLNEYKILDRLGRGRMAGVYKAVHHLGQVVAIKVLPPSKAKNPQTLGRFQREAQLALKLKHPNVVRAFQVAQTPTGLHYLVMEYLEGETLDEILKRRTRLPAPEAVRIVHQALIGLQHLHQQGMVHRDLKPSNLMLVTGGAVSRESFASHSPLTTHHSPPASTLSQTVKILDIGLGRTLFDDDELPSPERAELTGQGVLLGTPDYLSPEQASDPRSIDIRADIYSLGCVLYHALAGQPPFPDKNLLRQIVRHSTEEPRPLRDFNPEIPDGLQQIVSWMMAKQSDQRYPTPERAALALQVFLEAGSEPPRPLEEGAQMRRFLSWLEADGRETADELVTVETVSTAAETQGATRPRPSAPSALPPLPGKPVRPPTPTTPPAPVAAKAGAGPGSPSRPAAASSDKRLAATKKAPAPTTRPAPAAGPSAPADDIDVELVPLPNPRPLLAPGEGFQMYPRDWIMATLGAVAIILLGIFIWILSLIFGGSTPAEEHVRRTFPGEPL